MPTDLDPLDGIDWGGKSLLRSQHDLPELSIVKGDMLIVADAVEAKDGDTVVVTVEGLADVRRRPCEGIVIGRVIGIVRKLGDGR